MSQGSKIKSIEAWITKLRKLVALGSRKSIAEDMPGLQKELQELAGEGELGEALGPQLKTVLGIIAEGMKTEIDLSEPLSKDEEQLQQMVNDFRPEVENLILEIGPCLTPQEAAMFQMTGEIVSNNCQLRQFGNALQLLQQTWQKASEIQKESRLPVPQEPEPDPEPEVDLGPLVQAATQELGKLLAPWGPFLSSDDQIQFAFFASLLNQSLKEGEQVQALALIGAWAEAIEELPRTHRERILLELEEFQPPEEPAPPEWLKVSLVCEDVRKALSGGNPEYKDIFDAQQLLDALPGLVQAAGEAIEERKRCEPLWKADLENATKTLKEELAKIDKDLHGDLQKQLSAEEIYKQYGALRKKKVAGDYEELKKQLAQVCQGVASRMGEIAQELAKTRDESIQKEQEELENAPKEINDIGPLLLACVPKEKEDSTTYLMREDVTNFLGLNWLSFDAQSKLATQLNPEPETGNDDTTTEEGGGWTVTNDNPRVYFTDSAALDKAAAIIKKTKSGADPRKAATEEGCSTPTWYGNMLEIRLTQGGTQLRLIANNVSTKTEKKIEFTEVKSFHATGDKKAGYLNQYV